MLENLKQPWIIRRAIYGLVSFILAVLAVAGIMDETTINSVTQQADKIIPAIVMLLAYTKTTPAADKPAPVSEAPTGGLADHYRAP
ncbi:hypothetical protein HW450_06820 [Corynebacterium hindlerae]|uniref:Holin n=1 Tax=Corynebacterium hindlerae TaxID=699041 RepID=A0A7G5FBW1_9CORY|nr:hypothetical protein [Corynebacterium hindlerae]QMV84102.1 hypothetical protein HW450_06820 [Corynebacterium hindlerae]